MFKGLKKRKNIYSLLFSLLLCMSMPSVGYVHTQAASASDPGTEKNIVNMKKGDLTYRIVLDPGHGGNDTGADGWNSSEKRLNLLIGTYLKKELEKYNHVKVYMTRSEDVYVGLHRRMKIAEKKHADLVVSLHNDSWSSGTPYDNGSSVLVAKKGSYRPEIVTQEVRLARNVLNELEGLGLVNRGLVRKKSQNVSRYEDGSAGDYHAIIRDGMRAGIPSILIEHTFCDNKKEYTKYLKTEKKLRALAAADARGIARYLQLQRKDTGEVLPPIEVKEKTQVVTSDVQAYYTLPRKRYYNKLYRKMMAAGKQRHDTNLNIAEENVFPEPDENVEMEQAAREAEERMLVIQEKNKAGEKQMPQVIWMILGGFVLLLLIREFDFGFRFSIRVRRRGEIYPPWNHKHLQYNYKDTDQVN